jgi:hypothetical protein
MVGQRRGWTVTQRMGSPVDRIDRGNGGTKDVIGRGQDKKSCSAEGINIRHKNRGWDGQQMGWTENIGLR